MITLFFCFINDILRWDYQLKHCRIWDYLHKIYNICLAYIYFYIRDNCRENFNIQAAKLSWPYKAPVLRKNIRMGTLEYSEIKRGYSLYTHKVRVCAFLIYFSYVSPIHVTIVRAGHPFESLSSSALTLSVLIAAGMLLCLLLPAILLTVLRLHNTAATLDDDKSM